MSQGALNKVRPTKFVNMILLWTIPTKKADLSPSWLCYTRKVKPCWPLKNLLATIQWMYSRVKLEPSCYEYLLDILHSFPIQISLNAHDWLFRYCFHITTDIRDLFPDRNFGVVKEYLFQLRFLTGRSKKNLFFFQTLPHYTIFSANNTSGPDVRTSSHCRHLFIGGDDILVAKGEINHLFKT